MRANHSIGVRFEVTTVAAARCRSTSTRRYRRCRAGRGFAGRSHRRSASRRGGICASRCRGCCRVARRKPFEHPVPAFEGDGKAAADRGMAEGGGDEVLSTPTGPKMAALWPSGTDLYVRSSVVFVRRHLVPTRVPRFTVDNSMTLRPVALSSSGRRSTYRRSARVLPKFARPRTLDSKLITEHPWAMWNIDRLCT